MPNTTTINSIPYPDDADAPDYAQAFQDVAMQIDSRTAPRFSNPAGRNALIPSPVEGQLAWCDSTSAMYRYTGSAWVMLCDNFTWTKSSQIFTDGSLIPHPDLYFPVEANSVYVWELWGAIVTAGTFGGMATYSMTGPAGFTAYDSCKYVEEASTSVLDCKVNSDTRTNTGTAFIGFPDISTCAFSMHGVVRTSSTEGYIDLTFGVYAGYSQSYYIQPGTTLKYRKVG